MHSYCTTHTCFKFVKSPMAAGIDPVRPLFSKSNHVHRLGSRTHAFHASVSSMVSDSPRPANVPTIKRPTSSAFGRDGVVGGIPAAGIGFFLPILESFKKEKTVGGWGDKRRWREIMEKAC